MGRLLPCSRADGCHHFPRNSDFVVEVLSLACLNEFGLPIVAKSWYRECWTSVQHWRAGVWGKLVGILQRTYSLGFCFERAESLAIEHHLRGCRLESGARSTGEECHIVAACRFFNIAITEMVKAIRVHIALDCGTLH